MSENENKELFVEKLQEAFLIDSRYKHLEEKPVRYVRNGPLEFLDDGQRRVNVTGNSLSAIATEFISKYL